MSIQFVPENEGKNDESEVIHPTTDPAPQENPENTPEPSQGDNTPPAPENTPELAEIPLSALLSPSSPYDIVKMHQRNTANVERKPESKKRLSITVNFPGEEAEYLEKIIDARIKSGLTSDKGHFLRQCVDFAIHMEKLHGRHQAGFSFATPTDLPVIKMKGGFFK